MFNMNIIRKEAILSVIHQYFCFVVNETVFSVERLMNSDEYAIMAKVNGHDTAICHIRVANTLIHRA